MCTERRQKEFGATLQSFKSLKLQFYLRFLYLPSFTYNVGTFFFLIFKKFCCGKNTYHEIYSQQIWSAQFRAVANRRAGGEPGALRTVSMSQGGLMGLEPKLFLSVAASHATCLCVSKSLAAGRGTEKLVSCKGKEWRWRCGNCSASPPMACWAPGTGAPGRPMNRCPCSAQVTSSPWTLLLARGLTKATHYHSSSTPA